MFHTRASFVFHTRPFLRFKCLEYLLYIKKIIIKAVLITSVKSSISNANHFVRHAQARLSILLLNCLRNYLKPFYQARIGMPHLYQYLIAYVLMFLIYIINCQHVRACFTTSKIFIIWQALKMNRSEYKVCGLL